jgi:excisionase family DNA binding protein
MAPTPRFLSLADVAEVLNTSQAQVYALVRRGDLPAIRIGGRNQWRVESEQLEAYIARMYDETRSYVDSHPFAEGQNAAGASVDEAADEAAGEAAERSADL